MLAPGWKERLQGLLEEQPEKGSMLVDDNTLLAYTAIPGMSLLATVHERVSVLWRCKSVLTVHKGTGWFQDGIVGVV